MTTEASNVVRIHVARKSEKRIAAAVRAEMAARMVSQTDVAVDVFGSYQQKISRRHSGEVAWTAGELGLIADYLGVPVQKFYEYEWDEECTRRDSNPQPSDPMFDARGNLRHLTLLTGERLRPTG